MLGLTTFSCTVEEDDTFSENASIRMQNTLSNAKKILTSSYYGWHMHYYPGEEAMKYGGYNLLCKYNDDNTTEIFSSFLKPIVEEQTEAYMEKVLGISFDLDFPVYSTAMTYSSHYSLEQNAGPVLSFDTYNGALHFFTDPDTEMTVGYGESGLGMGGDFEFVIKEISEDENTISCYGKKTHNPMILTRIIPKDTIALKEQVESTKYGVSKYDSIPKYKRMYCQEWENIYDAIAATKEKMNVEAFVLNDGDRTDTLRLYGHIFITNVKNEKGETVEKRIPIMNNDDFGFSAVSKFTLKTGAEANLQNFIYDETSGVYVCSEDNSVTLTPCSWGKVNEKISWPKTTYYVNNASSSFLNLFTNADDANNDYILGLGYYFRMYNVSLKMGLNADFEMNVGAPNVVRLTAVDNKSDLSSVGRTMVSDFSYAMIPVSGTEDEVAFAPSYSLIKTTFNGYNMTGYGLDSGDNLIMHGIVEKSPYKITVTSYADDGVTPEAYMLTSLDDSEFYMSFKDVNASSDK